MTQAGDGGTMRTIAPRGGLAGWLLARLRKVRRQPRLALLERIALGPRQSLALVEAEGRRLLVAISPQGGAAFHALDVSARPDAGRGGGLARALPQRTGHGTGRVSW
ncbi:MAG: flagellar biosynthetic protein FliO [Terracidiphilus sp.]